ncbi:D-3-phosphoglycerate dehydrogenase [Planctomycetales bacterium 10988]|nr:D-3-phosphoglycerate dehydrogenase [Planctomycetales bacterium 10988]
MARVVILDNLAQEGLDLLNQAEGIEVEVHTGLKGEELRQTLQQYDGAICRSGVKLFADVLEGNQRLKAIVRAGVGTDNIDDKTAKQQGIIVMNTPAGNTLSTAEHAIALMLGLSRNIAQANQSLVEGRWDRKKFMGTQVAGKTLGVIGLGRIGQAVAQRAIGLEMKVVGFDPFLSSQRAKELGIETYETVKEILPLVDYLTVHTPLTNETRNLIDMDELEIIKPGVRLINCARGGIYNEAALVEGLKQGKIGGVALDVYENEPCTDSPLFGMPGVLATPHLGASTEEAQTNVAVEAAELLIDFFQTGAIKQSINMPAVDPKVLKSLKGYLDLTYRLGLLQSQLSASAPSALRMTYRGQIAENDTKLLDAAFAAGYLSNILDNPPNLVNSEEILRQRGVELSVDRQTKVGDFSSLVAAEVVTDKGSTTVAGTVFGNSMVRWVRLDDFRLEAYLDGTLLVFHHEDVPGIIGSVGNIFGRHGINIAQMAVGRSKPGAEAIGILNLDQEPTEEALQEVLQHDKINTCQVIQLPPAGELPDWLSS